MDNYKDLYYLLFNRVSDIIEQLKNIQQISEEMFITFPEKQHRNNRIANTKGRQLPPFFICTANRHGCFFSLCPAGISAFLLPCLGSLGICARSSAKLTSTANRHGCWFCLRQNNTPPALFREPER